MPSRSQRRPSRAWRWFERMVLGAGMSVVVWIIERRLLRELKKGSVEAAPRTAATAPETTIEHRQGEIQTRPTIE